MAENEQRRGNSSEGLELSETMRELVRKNIELGRSIPPDIQKMYDRQLVGVNTQVEVQPMPGTDVQVEAPPQFETNDEEVARRKQIAEDLKFVLEKVKKEVRNNPDLNDKYRKDLNDSKERLQEENIDVDAYIREGYTVSEEGNKELGRRKRVLMEVVEKMKDGGDLSDGENEIIEKIGLKKEDILVDREESFTVETQPRVENNKRKEDEFSPEEELAILQHCLDQVFIGKASSTEAIEKSLVKEEGFISIHLREGKKVSLNEKIRSKIELLGLENWVDVRDTVSEWTNFKDLKDIEPRSLTQKLFLDSSTEDNFAKKRAVLPFKNELTGKYDELREIDLGDEIGDAMRTLRLYFEGSINEKLETVAKEERVAKEYWFLLGAGLVQKEQLYSKLKINRYIGEAAFSLLLSYQMLTDTSKDDYMSSLAQTLESRVTKYKVKEAGDALVRMEVFLDLLRGKKPFTNFKDDEFKSRRAEMVNKLSKKFPTQMIPTGLSLGAFDEKKRMSEGEIHLREGDWIKWRVREFFTRSELDMTTVKENKKQANDNDSRLAMMQSGLAVLLLIKEIQDPSSGVDKMESLLGRLYAHVTGSLGDAYWLEDHDGVLCVPAELSPRNEEGKKEAMELKKWVSRIMLSTAEGFLFSHSICDHKNPKPMDMGQLAEVAERLFMFEPQTEKASYVGMSPVASKEQRIELMSFVDTLTKEAWKLIEVIDKTPDKYPSWYKIGVSASRDIKEIAKKSQPYYGSWPRLSKRLRRGLR